MVEVAVEEKNKSRRLCVGFLFLGLRTKEWARRVRQCVGRIVRAGDW